MKGAASGSMLGIGDPVIRTRLLILGILAVYVAMMVVSIAVLLPMELEIPLVMVGWMALLGVFAYNVRHLREWRFSGAAFFQPLVLTGVFAGLVAAATYLAFGWDVPSACQGQPVGCMRGYTWQVEDGRYFRVTPENQRNQIPESVYVREVGSRLRSASIFAVYSLCFAWTLAAGIQKTAGRST